METEIDSWAYFTHTPVDKPVGGVYTAHDRETGQEVGCLKYFFLTDDHTQIQFQEVSVEAPYRRRRVATALLRHLNHCMPEARINPGMRNVAGEGFMKHILDSEVDKVATNGILNVPLQTLMPPSFRPGDEMARMTRGLVY